MTDSDFSKPNRETRDGPQPNKSKIASWIVLLFLIGEALTPPIIFFVVFLGHALLPFNTFEIVVYKLWTLTWGRVLDNLPSTCSDPNVMSLVASYVFIPSIVIGIFANVVLWRRKGHPYLSLVDFLFFVILLIALFLTFSFGGGLSDC